MYLLEGVVRGGEVGQPGCIGMCWLQHYLHTYIPVVSGTVMVGIRMECHWLAEVRPFM